MKRKIVEYKILNSNYIEVLEQMVADAIIDGWQPFCGISEVFDSQRDLSSLSQAMVKYED